jgi:hypothetical protein
MRRERRAILRPALFLNEGVCKKCGSTIYWQRIKNKWTPFDEDGITKHFYACEKIAEASDAVDKNFRDAMQKMKS